MTENPYESPSEPAENIAQCLEGSSPEDLRIVTLYQRMILAFILSHLVFVGASAAIRISQANELLTGAFVGLLVTWCAGVVLVFLLALRLYSKKLAVLLGLLASIPIFGLIVLLMVHIKANSTLKKNGIEVGFLGASPVHI